MISDFRHKLEHWQLENKDSHEYEVANTEQFVPYLKKQ